MLSAHALSALNYAYGKPVSDSAGANYSDLTWSWKRTDDIQDWLLLISDILWWYYILSHLKMTSKVFVLNWEIIKWLWEAISCLSEKTALIIFAFLFCTSLVGWSRKSPADECFPRPLGQITGIETNSTSWALTEGRQRDPTYFSLKNHVFGSAMANSVVSIDYLDCTVQSHPA